MRRVALVLLALAALVGCRDQQRITAPGRVSADFSDGRVSGGNPHFFFLPPLVGTPSFSGTFNPNVRPVVAICQLVLDVTGIPIGCNAAAPTIHLGTVQLDLADQLYQVNWDTKSPPLDPNLFYRIQVRVAPGGTVLGFADIDPVVNGSQLKNVNTDQFIGLVDGRTLPIKFRIETGTFCKTTDCFEGTVGAAGGTFIATSGLAGTFFPAGALNQDVLLVIDRVDQQPCVPLDLRQFKGCYRFSTDPRPEAFNVLVTVGMCVEVSGLTKSQTDLFHIYQFDVGLPAVQLPNVPAAFLTCDPGHIVLGPPRTLRDLARYLASLLSPRPLHAAHLGVGGSSGSYSLFGWAQPATMAVNDGNGQTAVSGTTLPIAPSVVLKDSSGTAVSGATVHFAVLSGGGAITGPTVVTGTDGVARVGSWTLGAAPGVNQLTATVVGAAGSPTTFTATGVTITTTVIDPVGDATASAVTPSPDLVSATATAGGGNLALSVSFATGTFDPTTSHVFFNLDTDQNPATGFAGVDAAHNDATLLGTDFLVVLGSNSEAGTAKVLRFDAPSNSFPTVGSVPVRFRTDGMDVTVPLSLLGNDDGQMNFKVVVQAQLLSLLPEVGYTGILDYMPNLGLAPGSLTIPPPVSLK